MPPLVIPVIYLPLLLFPIIAETRTSGKKVVIVLSSFCAVIVSYLVDKDNMYAPLGDPCSPRIHQIAQMTGLI